MQKFSRRCFLAAAAAAPALSASAFGQETPTTDVSATGTPTINAPEYRLGPGDHLRVVVFGQADLSGEYVVSADGTVTYPLVGAVPAQNQTTDEFGAALAERLSRGFVRAPNVSVQVTTYRPFYILGEVNEPGTYPFTAGLTVRRAVATAGGFTYRASQRRVLIQRSGESAERSYPLTSSLLLHPGDVVRIPERLF